MIPMDGPDWSQEGRDWPNREFSSFVTAAGLRWHVQRMGSGPVLLLVHGTGAATHSWRDLAPLLSRWFTVVAPDLPGHGFTAAPSVSRLSLPGMARALDGLLKALGVTPSLVVGHSAGAAILARMALDGMIAPRAIISLNGAFLPFREEQGRFFSTLAKLLVLNPFVPRLFAWRAADRHSVERLIAGTGSALGGPGVDYYTRVLRYPRHVAAALGMMANWDLVPLVRDLPRLKCRLVLVAGSADHAVPPHQAERIAARVPESSLETLPKLGHLAHEERPDLVADIILRVARQTGVIR
ncbi:alpha/beta fold hydrolase BchO [Rhodocista pekingensis]|uniref:Alpha/beta fold hydrolase BchO n=1 Tax=Rhodocista pekingensis TaxID=201185 RepID=A0ABW2KVZ6_9PROT